MPIKFISAPKVTAVSDLTLRLSTELAAGNPVTWLLSGGSNIGISVQVMNGIDDQLTSRLSLSLIDERFGPVGHQDSNWQGLIEGGFNFKRSRALPILSGLDLIKTREKYQLLIQELLSGPGTVIGQLGIGVDGHIAGILPGSMVSVPKDQLVVAYQSDPFARLTLSFKALRQISAIYVFCYGSDKKGVLNNLKNKTLPLPDQPAAILKELKEVYLYNDQI